MSEQVPQTDHDAVIVAVRQELPTNDDGARYLGESVSSYGTLVATATRALEQAPSNPTYRQDILAIAGGVALHSHILCPALEVPRGRIVFSGEAEEPDGMPYQLHYLYRSALIETYERDPLAAEVLASHQIIGLHASGSAGLVGSLRNGIQPLETLRQAGVPIHTGTRDAVGETVRQGTSFLPFAKGYIERLVRFTGRPMTPEVLEYAISHNDTTLAALDTRTTNPLLEAQKEQLSHKQQELRQTLAFVTQQPTSPEEAEQQELTTENFPVVWGLSMRALDEDTNDINVVRGVDGEFTVAQLDHKDVPVALVPRDTMERVSRIVEREHAPVTVLPLESLLELQYTQQPAQRDSRPERLTANEQPNPSIAGKIAQWLRSLRPHS